ncbi:MAG: FAD-dependent oxidoreductase [Gammaproteobacteria bacterium]
MIDREPARAARASYDLIIVGGGIYGSMLLLESARRGLRGLLIEKKDFGSGTSFNSLRIIHGGMRYLQAFDLPRFFESVRERRWYMQVFPQLVKPLPCLMPLYGEGLRRKSVFRLALIVNDALSASRNKGVRRDQKLPAGMIISREDALRRFPMLDSAGMQGAAVWYDGCLPDSQRLLIEVLRWSCDLGSTALNYMEGTQLVRVGDVITGVVARDNVTGQDHEYSVGVVINAAGPWCNDVVKRFGCDQPNIFHSLAWNILLDCEPRTEYAVAVTPRRRAAQTYFVHPWKGMMLAGTGHAPWHGGADDPAPTREMIDRFLSDLNAALPKLNIGRRNILHIFSGLLPARGPGSAQLTSRPVFVDHGEQGGPHGIYSVSGIKFTTARAVAHRLLKRIFPRHQPSDIYKAPRKIREGKVSYDLNESPAGDLEWEERLRGIIEEESVQHLDDLIFRRTGIGDNPGRAHSVSRRLCSLFNWDQARCEAERDRIGRCIDGIRFDDEVAF